MSAVQTQRAVKIILPWDPCRRHAETRIRNALHQLIHSPLSECDWDEAIEALVEHDRLTAWDNRNAK